MGETVIEVNNVSKIYKLYDKPIDRLKEGLSITHKNYHTDHVALNNINLNVGKGECVGIIGTNGSGKSTLLKIITGVVNPTNGNIRVNGKISALLELGAGFNMEYTGIENIYLNGTMMGFSNEEIQSKINDIIDFAEIGDFINQPVKNYSSGMFARLAFAISINVDPDVLIVDEALSVGDIFFQAKCFRKFNEFKDKGKTILFVSHDMGSILKYCERCLLIHRGNQIALGKSKEIVDIYKKILANQYDEKEEKIICNNIDDNKIASGNILWKDSLINNPSFVEYGEKEAEIIDYAILDEEGNISSSINKNTKFSIRWKTKFNKKIKNPIFAFTIKDKKGTEITGSNTMLEHKTIPQVESGEEIVVSFDQSMPLQGGQYLLSIACTGYEMDELKIYHRLYDICFLEVFSTKDTVGFFDLNSEVEYIH